ncbi:hypothetical protein [Methanosarcina sp. KYL-1]|uniref:hypothetical protein n=1 Tax=Methanosarcina sp. KYL-1 TaxID=2602068 RepID=UPI0021012044|nr:hypothetical protein [Methanosarcina sp. KYL-1]
MKSIWVIALICLGGCVLTEYSTLALDSDGYSVLNGPYAQGLIQTEQNVRTCEQVAGEYYESHTYENDDVYDCDNMAQDVWNMLKKKGINARIAIGNLDFDNSGKIGADNSLHKNRESGSPGEIEANFDVCERSNLLNSGTIDSFNHAWVLAEVSPGSWLALECTGGYVVYSEDNENYYQGLTFSNPRNYRSFLELYEDRKARAQEYEAQRLYYNELVEKYNDASYSEQLVMKSGIEVAKNALLEKEKAFLKTDAELNALIKYG